MSIVPSLSARRIVAAFIRGGWIVVRQRGSHIRLVKQGPDGLLHLTVPAHTPVKRSTLAKIIRQAQLDIEDFLKLL